MHKLKMKRNPNPGYNPLTMHPLQEPLFPVYFVNLLLLTLIKIRQ